MVFWFEMQTWFLKTSWEYDLGYFKQYSFDPDILQYLKIKVLTKTILLTILAENKYIATLHLNWKGGRVWPSHRLESLGKILVSTDYMFRDWLN